MRLEDLDRKFYCNLEAYWREYKGSHVKTRNHYNLTRDQTLYRLHNVLSKIALCYYLDAVQPFTTTFQQAVAMIDREYTSLVRQNSVKIYLTSL